jgi:hypothetical protein
VSLAAKHIEETALREGMARIAKQLMVAAALLLLCGVCGIRGALAQSPYGLSDDEWEGSLHDVREKQRALLLVYRSGVLEVNDRDRSIIDEVLKVDPRPRGRHQWVYGQLAKKLNKYIRKYRSLTAAYDLSDADYVIYFNVVEYRQILNATYPYGELFVILKGSPETLTPPRVIWKAKKVLWAADAIGRFLKELKTVREEN